MSKREKENINEKEVASKHPAGPAKKRLRYEWQQTESELTIILYPGSSKVNYNVENVKFSSTESSCNITFQDGRSFDCDLYRVLVPEGTSIQFKSNKVILKMVKKAPELWKQLEARKEDEVEDSEAPVEMEINENSVSQEVEKHIVELQNLNHTFYEKNPETITVVVYLKNIKKDDFSIYFEDDRFTMKFKSSDPHFLNSYTNCEVSTDTTFLWCVKLKAQVQPQRCKFKIMDLKLEITLEKELPTRWDGIELTPTKSPSAKTLSSSWVPAVASTSSSVRESLESPKMASSSVITENSLEQLYSDDVTSNDSRKESKPTCLVTPLNKNQLTGHIKSGLTGLDNLGNTCFMNSILQCLANTSELKEFFLSGAFQQDINVENPLGLNGHLAVTFAVLLKNLWMGVQYSYAPSKLKMLIGQKVTQFSGFAQHDAQEFMAFFLDGLHEDLNRIQKKPYIENNSSDNKPDEDAADEAWQNYKKRNDSIVVDLFQGQYKSKLVCPTCSKVSITFDPFLYLSLPLPKDNCVVPIFYFFKDPRRKPCRYLLKVPVDASFGDVKSKLAQKINVPVKMLRGFSINQREPLMSLSDTTHISILSNNEKIFMFEVFDELLVGEPVVELTVVQRRLVPDLKNECSYCFKESLSSDVKLKRCTKCLRVAYCDVKCQTSHWPDHRSLCLKPEVYPLGLPFFISLPKSQVTFSVISRLLEGYSRHSVDVFQPPIDFKSAKLNQTLDSLSPQTPDAPGHFLDGTSPTFDEAVMETEKTISEMEISTNAKVMDASICPKAKGQQPVRLVIGQQSEKERFKPPFQIRAVDKFGQNLSWVDAIEDKGNEPLNLSQYEHIAMDWDNNSRHTNYVLVQSKELDYETEDEENERLLPNLDDCLKLFTEPEVLTSKDSWYCPNCKEHREATKQLSLWRLPPVLIIQLKRFSYGGLIHFRDKLDKMIDFPIRSLDLNPYVCKPTSDEDGPPIYDLYGVVNHEGGIFGGHYTSFARCLDPLDTRRSEFEWRLFDDSRVSFVSESSIVSEAAYVLFYRHRKPFQVQRSAPYIRVLETVSKLDEKLPEQSLTSASNVVIDKTISDNKTADISELDMID